MDTDVLHNPIVRSLIIILATLLTQVLFRTIIEKFIRKIIFSHRYENKLEERKREDTLINVLHTAVVILLWAISVLIILDTLGVNLAALATGAGVFGVIIGIGAQASIKDILSGMFILLENQYRVGDVITLSGGTTGGTGISGAVEEITLRITKLRDMDGTLNIVRNGEASVIANRTFDYSNVIIDVVVGFDSDIDMVEKVMNQVGIAVAGDDVFKKLIIEPIQFLRVDNFTPDGATARAYGKVVPASQWKTAGEYRRRLLTAFKQSNIDITLPQRVVHTMNTKAK